MTIINGIEIDICNNIPLNTIHEAIRTHQLANDAKLHVVIVVSNPCQYARRYILAREFIRQNATNPDIYLYVVELAYGDQQFYVTQADNARHLQLRTSSAALWHKENMINIGVRRLLPPDWQTVAWVDADIEFDNVHWANDALKVLLSGARDIVQLFSHALDLDAAKQPMQIVSAFGYQFAHDQKYKKGGIHYFHPGYAWACTRQAYDQMGGLYERSILGSGDHNMALSFTGHGLASINANTTEDYKASVVAFQHRANGLRLGYVPGIIRHYFHGSKANRKYQERWQILVKHGFCPSTFVEPNADGLLVPTAACPPELLADIFSYFLERNEDEGLPRPMSGPTSIFSSCLLIK